MMLALEALAALTGLWSVYLVTKQNIWCWPLGLVSVAVAAVVFYDSFLYSDMILHVYYFGMNVYGWVYWSRKPKDADVLSVSNLSFRQNVIWIGITAVGTAAWGFVMSQNTQAAFPFGDAFTTVASLVAQWFMAQKKLENWIYWFIIDVVAITIYAMKGLYLFSAQYVIFLILCAVGFRSWKNTMP